MVAIADTADTGVLAEAAYVAPDQVTRTLTEARMARVLVEPENDPDRPFVHDLYREAVLADLTDEDRRRWHGTVAAAWIRLSTTTPPHPLAGSRLISSAAVPDQAGR